MAEITLENRVRIVRIEHALDLVPDTIQSSAQLMSARRDEQDERLRDVLKNSNFITYNSVLYDLESKPMVHDAANGKPVLYLGNGRWIFGNFESVLIEMSNRFQQNKTRGYFPEPKDTTDFKKAKDTLRFELSELNLQYEPLKLMGKKGKKLPIEAREEEIAEIREGRMILPIITTYDALQNPILRKIAEWAYGTGKEYSANMGMLRIHKIRSTSIEFLDAYTVTHIVKQEGRPFARLCTLLNFEGSSAFLAKYSIGMIGGEEFYLRGEVTEDFMRVALKEQGKVDLETILARTRNETFAYLVGQIQEQYSAADNIQKSQIIRELVSISKISSHQIFQLLKSLNIGAEDISLRNVRVSSPYDPQIARNVRESAGRNRRQLVRELGFTDIKEIHVAEGQIQAYELGTRSPSYPSRGKVSPKYFLWLKDHGYNPFNL